MAAVQDLSTETQKRLLEAAGEVFAEHGFRDATIREICRRADANVAAVSYHFGDKRELYVATLKYAHNCAGALTQHRLDDQGLPPEERLRRYVRNFLQRLFASGRPSWHGRLIAREMAEPTALSHIVDEEIRPNSEFAGRIITDLVGPLPPEVLARCVASLVGQILHYHFARAVLKLISPVFAELDQDLDALAEHITQFSLAGLAEVAKRQKDQA